MTKRTQGMNWIRPAKRLAIYLRDGLACVWCGAAIEDEDSPKLTLDHLTPYSKGGSNQEKNLITCCHRCNSSRGNRSVKQFAPILAAYLGTTSADVILARIKEATKKKLNVPAAKQLIAERGGFVSACRS